MCQIPYGETSRAAGGRGGATSPHGETSHAAGRRGGETSPYGETSHVAGWRGGGVTGHTERRRCFLCEERGHLARSCWKRQKQQEGHQEEIGLDTAKQDLPYSSYSR
jgi:hypothetical protein